MAKELELAKTAVDEDKDALVQMVSAEKERRVAQAQRVVRRMLHSQLTGSSDSCHDTAVETKRKPETCRRVL